MNQESKGFIDLLNSMAIRHGAYQVFDDFVTFVAVEISNALDIADERKAKRQIVADSIKKRYSSDEMKTMQKMFNETIKILDQNPFQDFFGDIYMQLGLGSDKAGQFFTPYHLSLLCAEAAMIKEAVASEIEKNGYIFINEPACGAGANVIAAMEVLAQQKVNYQERAFVVCQDISRTTALMCYVQLSLIGVPAVIKIGDTLRNPFCLTLADIETDNDCWISPMLYSERWMSVRIAEQFRMIFKKLDSGG